MSTSRQNQQHVSPQLRYHPPAHRSFYPASQNQQRYSIKRPRYENNSVIFDENKQFDTRSPAPVVRPIAFQIRHRSTDKTRGLRHFAHKVCEKVKEKGQTNYNEVADELVTEYFDQMLEMPQDPEKYQYDVRNIRRRVYDALNVLMAMNIIEKEKKEIRWVGLPTSSLAECRRLEEEKTQRQERIRQKTEQLQELIVQLVAYKSLVQRNREKERLQGRPSESAILYLPYIIVSTDKKTMVECAIAPDKSEYWFNFDQPFEIHDDIEVLKRLGLAYGIDRGDVLPENIPHIKSCLPPALRDYVDQILEGTLISCSTGKQPKIAQRVANPHTNRKSFIKLSPNTGALTQPTPGDPIVVRATRANLNLSGVASAGDGGPMGSFLSPVVPPAVKALPPPGAAPIARYAVIPRPRYSNQTIIPGSRFASSPMTQLHQQHYMPPHRPNQPRLGGILHCEVPVHPLRDPLSYQPRDEFVDEEHQHMAEYQQMLEEQYDEHALTQFGEQIIEEVVADDGGRCVDQF